MANSCNRVICRTLVEKATDGWTFEEIAALVGVTSRTFREWRNQDSTRYEKEFAEAYETAKTLQKSWWLRRGRDNVGNGRDFNTALYSLYMANMFKWGGQAAKDEAYRKLEERARRAEKALGIVSEEDDE